MLDKFKIAFPRLAKETANYAVVFIVAGLVALLWQYANLAKRENRIVGNSLDAAYSMVIVCNERGSPIYANRRFREVTGYSTKELYAGGISLIIPPDQEHLHAQKFTEAMDRFPGGDSESTATRLIEVCKKDGGRVPAIMRVTLVSTDAGPVAYAYVMPVDTIREMCEAASLNCTDKSPAPVAP